MSVTIQTAVRFVIGGSLVAAIPLVAQHFGPRIAGIVVLFPAVTVGGYIFLGLSMGRHDVEKASAASLVALPAVAAYLITVHLLLRNDLPLSTSLAGGILSWILVAIALTLIAQALRLQ